MVCMWYYGESHLQQSFYENDFPARSVGFFESEYASRRSNAQIHSGCTVASSIAYADPVR